LELECDVLLPCALENEINSMNADNIKTKIIVEGANGPVTPIAESILESKGTVVIPDLLANSGGVTVSYFEWLKNISHMRFGRLTKRHEEDKWNIIKDSIQLNDKQKEIISQGSDEEALVRSGLEETMTNAFRECYNNSVAKNCNLRTSAYHIAISKVGNTFLELGF